MSLIQSVLYWRFHCCQLKAHYCMHNVHDGGCGRTYRLNNCRVGTVPEARHQTTHVCGLCNTPQPVSVSHHTRPSRLTCLEEMKTCEQETCERES